MMKCQHDLMKYTITRRILEPGHDVDESRPVVRT